MVERGSHFSGAPHQRLELSVPLTAPIRRVVSALAADYKSPVVPLATELLWNLLDNSPAAAAIAASPSDAAQFAATLTQLTHALLQRGYRCVCVCVCVCVCALPGISTREPPKGDCALGWCRSDCDFA